jgi:Holliday junction resolvasome RuvABC endonuclease subunit
VEGELGTVLGLDISSSVIGWALLEDDGKGGSLIDYGHLKPPPKPKGSIAFRASAAYDMVSDLLNRKSPDSVAIEAYASKFSAGRSTARTIIVLSVFNEVISMACLREASIEPHKYAVSTIRSCLSKIGGRKISSKEEAFDFIVDNITNFKTRENRAGNLAKQCLDEADAIAVALAHIYKESNNG